VGTAQRTGGHLTPDDEKPSPLASAYLRRSPRTSHAGQTSCAPWNRPSLGRAVPGARTARANRFQRLSLNTPVVPPTSSYTMVVLLDPLN
jgi:hypothetical protein